MAALENESGLPFDIAGAAAMVLYFHEECSRSCRSEGGAVRERLLAMELPDVVQGAFELLSGAAADPDVVRRPELGE